VYHGGVGCIPDAFLFPEASLWIWRTSSVQIGLPIRLAAGPRPDQPLVRLQQLPSRFPAKGVDVTLSSDPTIKVEQSPDVTIITLARCDNRELENDIATQLLGRSDEIGASHLLINFANVDYVSSLELGTLVGLHRQREASGGRLTLFNLSPRVYEFFTITRLNTLLDICREASDRSVPVASMLPVDRRRWNRVEQFEDPLRDCGGEG
jgi:anti-sigma B factor antagonist